MSVDQKIEIDDLICNFVTRLDILQPLSAEEASSITGGLTPSSKDVAPLKHIDSNLETAKTIGPFTISPIDKNFIVGPVRVEIRGPDGPNGEPRFITVWAY